jgi:alpha galactosidase C-like protein
MRLNLERLGLDRSKVYTARDLWSGAVSDIQRILNIDLSPGASAIFRLTVR